jgi:hypothetical protein
VIAVIAVLVLVLLAAAIRVSEQYERGAVSPREAEGRAARTGARAHHSDLRSHPSRVAADRDDADPVAGHHHAREGQRRHRGRGVLPHHGRRAFGDRDRGCGGRDYQIVQTTLRSVVGQYTLDEMLAGTEKINRHIREILDVQTEEWGAPPNAASPKTSYASA